MTEDVHTLAFREEAHELLANLESSLLDLEDRPHDQEVISSVFRAMHTIKGSGAMFGFDEIASFTHEIETVFDMVRNGKITVSKRLVDLTLDARDMILTMLDDPDSLSREARDNLRAAFTTLLPGSVTSNPNPPSPQPQDPGVPATYRIRIVPSPELFFTGTNPLLLLQELLSLGEGRVVAHTDGIPLLSDMDPELCHTYWDVILTTDKGVNSIRDVFIFVEDSVKLTIEEIPLGSDGEEYKRIGEILVERGDVSREEVAKVLAGQRPLGEILVEKGLISPDKVVSALTEQDHVRGLKEKKEKEDQVSSIRVHATKLDTLVDLVGELVTVQARLSAKAVQSNDPDLMLIAEEVERLTEELRDNTMSIRMVPIGSTFGRFKRLVRDLSHELGKEIELTTEGAETELDKTVIERLNDPLVHLIRNSIDHGIEIPEERDSLGKPRCGMVNLAARHSGSHVLIEVSDDGKGLDAEVIRAKAIERGLLSPDLELRDKEIFAFLFAPGFSTAEKVTSVSGRGVGMDVVKRTIDSLRGSIDITTEKGTGTTITLKIPLTLAIIEGLLVTIGDGYFVLPLSAVEECIELVHRQGEEANGRRLVTLRDKLVPYIRLREQFTIQGEVPGIEQVVITASDGQKIGFAVDQVIGEHQTVIKNLGSIYRNVEGGSGATILGDGTVALILDVQHLARAAEFRAAQHG